MKAALSKSFHQESWPESAVAVAAHYSEADIRHQTDYWEKWADRLVAVADQSWPQSDR